jgi:hypothetical protein
VYQNWYVFIEAVIASTKLECMMWTLTQSLPFLCQPSYFVWNGALLKYCVYIMSESGVLLLVSQTTFSILMIL